MNHIKKICILGLDALEYDLVEKWDLKELKQEEYGKVRVPISERTDEPHSVQVWGSFLTGEIYERDAWKEENKLLSLVFWIRRNIIEGTGLWKPIKRKFEITRKGTDFPNLEKKSFIDEGFDKVNAPFYNYKGKDKFTNFSVKYTKGEISQAEFIQMLNQRLEREIKDIKKKLPTNRFFGYLHTLDFIQHLFCMKEDYLKEKYKRINKFVGKVRKQDIDFILIISDHGCDMGGGHSNLGFYSTNKRLGIENPHITDFYDIIMEELDMPTKDDIENIKRKLKDLGYI